MKITKESIKEKLKDDFRIRLALLFVLGFLLGLAIKTEAMDRTVIGFDDYKIKAYKHQGYDFDAVKERIRMEREAMQSQMEENNNQ